MLFQALHRMREYERKLAEAKGEDAHGASPTNLKRHLQPPEKKSGDTTSEVTSSSAQDQGSESSISDVPVSTRFSPPAPKTQEDK